MLFESHVNLSKFTYKLSLNVLRPHRPYRLKKESLLTIVSVLKHANDVALNQIKPK